MPGLAGEVLIRFSRIVDTPVGFSLFPRNRENFWGSPCLSLATLIQFISGKRTVNFAHRLSPNLWIVFSTIRLELRQIGNLRGFEFGIPVPFFKASPAFPIIIGLSLQLPAIFANLDVER